ncbi:MAG: LPS export ABC transporter permease LptG [Pseudomonadota bacterium]
MKLHLYFARRFFTGFAGAFAALFLILALIDMLEQVRRFDSDDVSFGAILTLTLLNVPEAAYRALPLIMILGSIAVFIGLSRSSELVIARAAGRSALATLVAPVTVAVLIGVAAVAIFNPLVAATSKAYDARADRYAQADPSVLSISREGLWLRQGGSDGQTVIRAARANFDGTELILTSFFTYDTDGRILRRVEGRRATLQTGRWQVEDAKIWPLGEDGNPEANAREEALFTIPTDLTPNQIIDSFGNPSSIPIWALPGFIQNLEDAGFSARNHRVWFQMELALPLLLAGMVLVAAGFTLRPARFGRTGVLVVAAIGLGFTLFFMRNFAQILGENAQISVALAAWGPPTATFLLPLGLLLHLEDG